RIAKKRHTKLFAILLLLEGILTAHLKATFSVPSMHRVSTGSGLADDASKALHARTMGHFREGGRPCGVCM
ncbi:MAG: hypothetical protein LBD21_02690, partial [Tannerellaceae bacterium]|nr:hypothetical protein [Tannerellaceae bacterium]